MSRHIILKLFLGTLILGGILYTVQYHSTLFAGKNISNLLPANANAAAPISVSGDGLVSSTDLHADYTPVPSTLPEKVRILIVPGHEPDYGGALFGVIKERDLVAEIGADLQQFLDTNSNYQVFITRDVNSWNPVFSDYFNNEWNAIIAWENTAKENTSKLSVLGAFSVPLIDHISVPDDVALRLYGINKWANENSIDLMIHLHLNDYFGHPENTAGQYSGLVIYTPAVQYSNSGTTKAITDAVFKRLSLYNPTSNLSYESNGILDDPELIAVGANNTADAASMLIEYNYLYEPQFVNPKVRSLALKDFAYQTYLGLQDFFNKTSVITAASSYDPASLYFWDTPVKSKASNPEDIYAMQTALIMDADFPPVGKSKNSCPHSGTFGVCTREAIKEFQQKNKIVNESVFGPKTFSLLNSVYIKTAN